MKKEKTENTGFRNGRLFCFNCGVSQAMKLPMNIKEAGELMISFGKKHENCQKVWKEPHWSETEGMQLHKKAQWWQSNADRGRSSEFIFHFMTSATYTSMFPYPYPSDPSDFNKCYFLIKAIPEWRPRLPQMKVVSKVWSNIVDNWDKMSELLEQQIATGKDNNLYEFMKQIGC